MKELVARAVRHAKLHKRSIRSQDEETISHTHKKSIANSKSDETLPFGRVENNSTKKRESSDDVMLDRPSAKRSKAPIAAIDFLGINARKAKEAKSARTAARVGMERCSKINKVSHTGSGIPLSRVVRLKYLKGFTQAVRTPCRMEDLM